MPLVIFEKNFGSFPSIFARIRSSKIFAVTQHTRNQNFLERYPKKILLKRFTLVLLDGFLNGFSELRFFIVEICILIWDFWVIFENYSMGMLNIRGNDFTAHWAYEEMISSHTEHTRNEFHRWLSIRGMDFIAGWACAEMFKSRISRPNRKRFSKISCYRPSKP